MKVQDHFLTKEIFSLESTAIEGILQTTPIPEDLAKYYDSTDYISHHQDDSSLTTKIYKFFQSFNLRFKANIVASVTAKYNTVLDYGCGAGEFLRYIQGDYNTVGFEPNPQGLNFTSKKTSATIIQSLDEIKDGSIHTITMWHVLEHIPNTEEILEKLYKKLKTGGHLIVAVPNHGSYDAKYYGPFWAAYDVPRHVHHYTIKGLKNRFDSNSWKIKKWKPLLLDAFYISIISEKYRKNPLRWFKGGIVGAISNIKALKSNEFSSVVLVVEKI